MGSMTRGAVLRHGLVFPQEWATLFSMTGGAGLIDRYTRQQGHGVGTMGVVAIIAGHQPLGDRMVAAQIHLGSLLQVTTQAYRRI